MHGWLWRYGLPTVTFLAFGLQFFWHNSTLLEMASGEPSLDLRWQGYGQTDVAQYLGNLTDEGRAFYLGPVRLLDSILPVLWMATLLLPLRMAGRLLGWLSVPALAYMVADLAENFSVARLLNGHIEDHMPSEVWTQLASTLTTAKFGCFTAACLIAIGAVIARRNT